MTNRDKLRQIIEHPRFQFAILAVILFNAAILGFETSQAAVSQFGTLLFLLDRICLGIFVVEIGLKIIAYRLGFFRSGWNNFDFGIVAISLLPVTQGLTVLRALRIIRLLRVISVAPALRKVVEALFRALPGMGSVFFLMAIIFYIGAVIATKLFGSAFDEWFGTIGRSAYSLFQIMTLESWSMGIARPVMAVYPMAWLFFIPFILVTTFVVVNLVVGLVVSAMQSAHGSEVEEQTDLHRDKLMARLDEIEKLLRQPSER